MKLTMPNWLKTLTAKDQSKSIDKESIGMNSNNIQNSSTRWIRMTENEVKAFLNDIDSDLGSVIAPYVKGGKLADLRTDNFDVITLEHENKLISSLSLYTETVKIKAIITVLLFGHSERRDRDLTRLIKCLPLTPWAVNIGRGLVFTNVLEEMDSFILSHNDELPRYYSMSMELNALGVREDPCYPIRLVAQKDFNPNLYCIRGKKIAKYPVTAIDLDLLSSENEPSEMKSAMVKTNLDIMARKTRDRYLREHGAIFQHKPAIYCQCEQKEYHPRDLYTRPEGSSTAALVAKTKYLGFDSEHCIYMEELRFPEPWHFMAFSDKSIYSLSKQDKKSLCQDYERSVYEDLMKDLKDQPFAVARSLTEGYVYFIESVESVRTIYDNSKEKGKVEYSFHPVAKMTSGETIDLIHLDMDHDIQVSSKDYDYSVASPAMNASPATTSEIAERFIRTMMP